MADSAARLADEVLPQAVLDAYGRVLHIEPSSPLTGEVAAKPHDAQRQHPGRTTSDLRFAQAASSIEEKGTR